MPCAHEKSVPAGPVVVYDGTGGQYQPDTAAERIDYVRMWARAHGRRILAGPYVETGPSAAGIDFGDGLVFPEFEGAVSLLDLWPDAWLLVMRPDTLHPDAGVRRRLANRVGGRVACVNGERVPHDHAAPAAPHGLTAADDGVRGEAPGTGGDAAGAVS